MVAGGFDDISEEGSYEFANMKATSNAETELAMGREPTEMSRPATTCAGVSHPLPFTGLSHYQPTVYGGARYRCAHGHERVSSRSRQPPRKVIAIFKCFIVNFVLSR